ncbi:hypothetical protein IWZ01DRAFT_193530 [Phyllosticta capitalensis]
MLARTALARLRAQAPRSSARDVAHISRQLAHTFLTSSTITSQMAIAPAVESFRAYATATRTKAKPKPKAKATTKKSPAKKTATRKTAAKKPVKKKAVKKTVKKKVVKKPAPKRRGLTERQKMLKEKAKVRANILQLKETALEEPKKLPQSAWSLYLGEYHRNVSDGERSAPEVAKKASEAFKTISSSEMERLQKQAEENSRRNKENYAKWVRSHTPKQILEANRARSNLKRKLASYKKSKIQDDRLLKIPQSAFLRYSLEFQKRPDIADLPFGDKSKKASDEWKSMPASQKQKYEDAVRSDRERYFKEYKSLYGEDAPAVQKEKAKAKAKA